MRTKLFTNYAIQILFIGGVYFCMSYFLFSNSLKSAILQTLLYSLIYFFGLPIVYKLISYLKKPNIYKLEENEQILIDEEVKIFSVTYLQKSNLKVTNKHVISTFQNQSKVYSLLDVRDIVVSNNQITFHFTHFKTSFVTKNAQAILDKLEDERQNARLVLA